MTRPIEKPPRVLSLFDTLAPPAEPEPWEAFSQHLSEVFGVDFETDILDWQSKTDSYLESFAKTHTNLKKESYRCQPNYILTSCKNGHLTIRHVFCGKEWCEVCGEKGSPVHKRRMARAWHRIVDCAEDLGYLVVTIPPQIGDLRYDPDFLKRVKRYVWRKLLRDGITKWGLCRMHWEGDKSKKYFPHWNFLFPSRWIEKEVLVKFREDYTRWLKETFKVDGFESADIHYEFATNVTHKIHLLEYVTRPTLRHWSPLKGQVYAAVRGTSWFGKRPEKVASQNPVEPIPEEYQKMLADQKLLDLLGHGRCPVCGEPSIHEFIHHQSIDLGTYKEAVEGQLWVKLDST
jgi:hypothetical protein